MTTPYIDPNLIFAENAPVQDKPAAFQNYDKGWDASRNNDGRPLIPQMNYLTQQADLKNLYIHENGAALPYKEGIAYEENAVVVKDGVLQQLKGGEWVVVGEQEVKKYLLAAGITEAELDTEYNYLMQRLAQIAVDKGWDASFVVDGDKTQKQINNIVLDPNLAPLGWTQKDFNDTFVDVRKFIKKDMSNATAGFQAAIEAAYGGTLTVPIPLKLLDTIYVNRGLKIKGVRSSASNYATDLPLLDFSGLGANKYGIYVAEINSVIGFGLENTYLVGAKNGGCGLKLGSTLAVNCSDYSIEKSLIRNFTTGVEQSFAWDGSFRSIRVQGCTDGVKHLNQVNAVLYSQCAVVGSSNLALQFINAEGVQLDACDISNCTKTDDSPITMYQSTVTFNTPYFENIDADSLITIGSSAATIGSSLMINNPLKLGKNIVVSSEKDYVEINGQDRNSISIVGSNLNTIVNAKASQKTTKKVKNSIFSWNPKQILTIVGYGGVTATLVDNRNYMVLNSTSATGGWNITNSLEIGKTYTMRYAIRKTADTSVLGIRNPSSSLGLNVSDIGANPTIKTIAFVAAATSLNMTWAGSIELYGLEIIEGNLSEFSDDPFKQNEFDRVIEVDRSDKPTAGTWKNGDTVKRAPTNANPITEYIYQSSAWLATKWVVLRLATTALPVLTQYDTGVEVYDTTTSTFKRWNGTTWI